MPVFDKNTTFVQKKSQASHSSLALRSTK